MSCLAPENAQLYGKSWPRQPGCCARTLVRMTSQEANSIVNEHAALRQGPRSRRMILQMLESKWSIGITVNPGAVADSNNTQRTTTRRTRAS